MSEAINEGQPIPVEIRIRGETLNMREHRGAILQVWNDDELIDLLRNRMGKSELEVRRLLDSYHLPATLERLS